MISFAEWVDRCYGGERNVNATRELLWNKKGIIYSQFKGKML